MRRILPICLAALLSSGGIARSMAPDGVEPEDQLKAVIVLAIIQNAKWAVEEGDRKLTIGVWGRSAMEEAIRQTAEGKVINGRTVRVVRLGATVDPRCCRVYYVATGRKAELQRLLPGASAGHVLTIGEDDRFLDAGGALNLFLSDGHMAFEVSLEMLERSGVTISSKLLRFGKVRGPVEVGTP